MCRIPLLLAGFYFRTYKVSPAFAEAESSEKFFTIEPRDDDDGGDAGYLDGDEDSSEKSNRRSNGHQVRP